MRSAPWFMAAVTAPAMLACGSAGDGASDPAAADLPIIIARDVVWDTAKPDARADSAADPWADGGADAGPDLTGDDGPVPDPGEDPGAPEVDFGADPAGEPGCVPNCTGKVCGSNGCGGSCGTCPDGFTCTGGDCICIPDCGGGFKECGPDGCGGECGVVPCPEGCTPPPSPGSGGAPEFKCMTSGPCKKYADIRCADLTREGTIGMGGSTDTLDVYSCAATPAHGPENAYRFVPDDNAVPAQGAVVTFTLKDPQRDYFNIYLLRENESGCSSKQCVAWSHTSIEQLVKAGEVWWIVVDATENNSGYYDLVISCAWEFPPAAS